MSYKITSYRNNQKFQLPEEIFIVFTDLPHNSRRFYGLRTGFSHCFMLYRFGEDWWVVDPLFCGITHGRIENLSRASMIDLLLSQQCHIIVLDEAYENNFKLPRVFGKILEVQLGMMSFGIFSCVTLVKRALGIRRPWLITPFGLYKFFMRTNKENY